VVVTVYYRGQVVGNDGSSYVCILDHTSSAGDEPGVGGSWTTYWEVVAAAGTGLTTGDKGDITVSAGGATWTIDNDAVTYAKIQNVSAASKLLGRGDSGSGDVQEITLGSGLSMTGTTLAATGGGVTDGDKGDITVSASGATWTIDPAAVTFAKMQDITSHHLVGRHAGSTGTPQEVGVGNGVEFHGSGIRRSQLIGDVEASAGSNTTTIATGAVTLAKMANLATDRLIGRDTAGTGSPEALTVGGGIEFTGSGGIQTAAFTGDVTKTAGGTALTIANDAVTDSKILAGAVRYSKIEPPSGNYVLLGDTTTGGYGEILGTASSFALIEGSATSTDFANLGFKTAVNRNISEGTASPTGGADGDIYLQYV
jgi:hypothetical protein